MVIESLEGTVVLNWMKGQDEEVTGTRCLLGGCSHVGWPGPHPQHPECSPDLQSRLRCHRRFKICIRKALLPSLDDIFGRAR